MDPSQLDEGPKLWPDGSSSSSSGRGIMTGKNPNLFWGTYFNYVRTIGGRGVGKMRTNAYRGEVGCHPYAYVRSFSHMDPTKIRFSTI